MAVDLADVSLFQLILGLAAAIVGTQAVANLVTEFFRRRKTQADTHKTEAEAVFTGAQTHKAEAEATGILQAATDSAFDRLQTELQRLSVEVTDGRGREKLLLEEFQVAIRNLAKAEAKVEILQAQVNAQAEQLKAQAEQIDRLTRDLAHVRGRLAKAEVELHDDS